MRGATPLLRSVVRWTLLLRIPAPGQEETEWLVIDDAGASPAVRELAARFGASYEPHATPLGLNAARNTGVERSHGELVVFVDDDVRVSSRWLDALLLAARENPDVDVFTGPIYDQAGTLKVPKGEKMSLKDLATIDWYVKGVQS